MKRILLCAAMVLALTACGGAGQSINSAASLAAVTADAAGVPAPAPLAKTTFDEKALILAAHAIDTAALSVSALVRAHVIEPGTPRAMVLANGLDKARDGINAAAEARKAGSAATYTAAIADAEAAVAQIKQAIGERP